MGATIFTNPANLLNIPQYVKAKTPEGLRTEMLKTNTLLRSEVRYFCIQFANGFWYAWYFVEIEGI